MKKYRPLFRSFFGLAGAVAGGRPRSFQDDCRAAIESLGAPPAVFGAANIPATGGFLLVANHWQRPGHWIGFTASALSVPVFDRRGSGSTLSWIVTDRCNFRWRGSTFSVPFSTLLFRRVAATWGLTAVETGRSSSPGTLRRLVRYVAGGGAAAVFPEGEYARAGPPGRVAAGSERLARLLGDREIPILPSAFAEIAGSCFVRYGEPYLSGESGPTIASAIRNEFDALLIEAK